jgi:hypothetical protein
MGRRKFGGIKFGPVADYPVAPHRYKWDAVTPDDLAITWREVRDAAPYKAGEVVFVVYGDGFRRAIISSVEVTKDASDFWRECYHVFPETKAGQWSKLYYVAHPGFVQRGYQRAGLAPEMPPAKTV